MGSKHLPIAAAAVAGLVSGAFLAHEYWPARQTVVGHHQIVVGQRPGCACLCGSANAEVPILPPEQANLVSCVLPRNQDILQNVDEASPPVKNPEDEILRVEIDDRKLIMMASQKKVAAVEVDNPKVATVSMIPDHPSVLRVTGLAAGRAHVILRDDDGRVEIKEVMVVESEEEKFRHERRIMEKRRDILSQLVRQVAPASDVDVILTLWRRSKDESGLRFGSAVILQGSVTTSEEATRVVDLTNAVFGGPPGAASGPPLATVLNRLQVAPLKNVEVRMSVAMVDRKAAKKLGLLEQYEEAASIFSVLEGTRLGFRAVRDSDRFAVVLKKLRDGNALQAIAEPRFLTASGRPANYVDGGQIPVIAEGSASYLQHGIVINVLPIVLGNGKINLELAASISWPNPELSVVAATGGSLGAALAQNTVGAQQAIQMENGQTMALAGLTHRRPVDSRLTELLANVPFIVSMAAGLGEDEFDLVLVITPSCPACPPPMP